MVIQLNTEMLVGLERFIDQNIEEIRRQQANKTFEPEDMLKVISIAFSICNITGVKIPKMLQGVCNFTDADGMNEDFVVNQVCNALLDLSYDIDQIGESGTD